MNFKTRSFFYNSDKSNQTVRDTILFKKLKSELREKSINGNFKVNLKKKETVILFVFKL
jgi:hypothetical protein